MNNPFEIVDKIEALLTELKTSLGATPSKTRKPQPKAGPEEKGFSGLTGEIHNLVQEGFFKEPKTLSEIQNKLRLEGVNKPTTSLMKPLILLIRRKVLGRSEAADGKGPFRYHQR